MCNTKKNGVLWKGEMESYENKSPLMERRHFPQIKECKMALGRDLALVFQAGALKETGGKDIK